MSGTPHHVTKQACFSVTESAYNFFFVLFNRERQFFITGGESTRCLNTMNCERCRYYEGTLGENTSAANAFIPLNC